MDIEDKCTETGRAFQRLKIGEDTLALRSNGAAAATRRKRKPKPYIPRQNLEQRPYARNKPLEIVPSLVRHDVITFFANHFETALDSWISIVIKTKIPDNVASSDPCVLNSFQLLDKARTDGDKMLSRLAYIRLAYVFESLQKIVASDRQNGQLPARRRGYRNASIATDIYIEAQQAVTSRAEVKLRNRVARRWRILAGPSPIFVIIYSEVVERLANRTSIKNTERELEQLASDIVQNAPARIVKASQLLATMAEYAIRSHQSVDVGLLTQVRQELLGG